MPRSLKHAATPSVPVPHVVAVPIEALPSALADFDAISACLGSRTPVLCLDFDGTLSPIVEDPTAAVLLDGVRPVLERLVRAAPTLVLSGRDAADVRDRIGIPDILYAGSHGFEVVEADGTRRPNIEAIALLPALDAAEAQLRQATAAIPGVVIDRKRFSVAVHDRQVAETDFDELWAITAAVAADWPMLRPLRGKRVTEFLPDIDWNKGRALLWLLERAGYTPASAVPICIGDDVTDEDALLAVRDIGIGIVVGSGLRTTAASYSLEDPSEVRAFLDRLAVCLEGRAPAGAAS